MIFLREDNTSHLQYLSFIKELYAERNFIDAALHCSRFCKQHKKFRNEVENIYVHSLCVYGQYLENCNSYDELISFYDEVLHLYPRNKKLNCNYGAQLIRIGRVREAEHLFDTILTWNRNYLPAFKHLQNIYNLRVERWHFRMLNDQFRNEAYKRAIEGKIKQGFDTVLDIGTGTGLLSIYAAKNGAAATYACDNSKTMVEIASQVIAHNQVDVKLLNQMSFSLVIGVDIPKRVSLVVTEIMDCGLLGEGLLSTILHAWDELLVTSDSSNAESNNEVIEHGCVIPSKVSFFVNVIECDDLARRYVYPIRQRASIPSASETCRSLNLDNVILYASKIEPYDTEPLKMLQFKYLSDFQRLLSINLNDRDEVWKNKSDAEVCKTSLKINCISSGYAHALVGCFEAVLDDNIILSNDPTVQRDSCWEQAIFPLKEAVKVVEGSILIINANWLGENITMDLIEVIHPTGVILPGLITLENRKHVSLDQERTKGDINDVREHENEVKAFEVSKEVVSLFNDENFVNYLYGCAEYFVSNIETRRKTLFIFDGSVFPFLGLMIVHNLHLLSIDAKAVKLMVNLDASIHFGELIKHVIKSNGIMETNVEQFDINELCLDDSKNSSLDMIVTDVIEKEGDLNDLKMLDTKVFRKLLKETGSLYPLSVSIQFQLVESSWLDNVSTIKNTEMIEMGIASLMNEYKVTHHLDINLNRVNYVPLSDVLEARQFSLGIITDQLKPLKIEVPILKSGTVTGICYWYNMYHRPDEYYSTLNSTSYYRQAAFLTIQDTKVSADDVVFIDFQYVEGIIKLSISSDNDSISSESNSSSSESDNSENE